MGHLIGKSELFNRSRRVSAADDGDSVALGNSGSHAAGSGRELIPLGNSHRTIPYNGAGALDCIAEENNGCRSDIKTHIPVGNIG